MGTIQLLFWHASRESDYSRVFLQLWTFPLSSWSHSHCGLYWQCRNKETAQNSCSVYPWFTQPEMKLVHILLVHDFRTKLFTQDFSTIFKLQVLSDMKLTWSCICALDARLSSRARNWFSSFPCTMGDGNEAKVLLAEVVFSWQAKDSLLVVRCCAANYWMESYTSWEM